MGRLSTQVRDSCAKEGPRWDEYVRGAPDGTSRPGGPVDLENLRRAAASGQRPPTFLATRFSLVETPSATTPRPQRLALDKRLASVILGAWSPSRVCAPVGVESRRVESTASPDPGNAADLVSRIRAGDHQAETELVERFGRGVLMILRRSTRNAAVSDDLYQDTFRIALEKVRQGDLRDSEKLAAFICSVARNLVIEHFRRTARQENLTEVAEAERPPYSAPNQLDAVLQKEKAAIVRQVINELPTDRDRQVLFRFYVVEDEKDKICADIGLSSLHFNRVLHRARERYRELYERALSRIERGTGH